MLLPLYGLASESLCRGAVQLLVRMDCYGCSLAAGCWVVKPAADSAKFRAPTNVTEERGLSLVTPLMHVS